MSRHADHPGRNVCLGLLMVLLLATTQVKADWPAWQAFMDAFVSADGRVIDSSTAERITTSEGQAYGLFFALVAGDQAGFSRLLDWTENNLAQGDLGNHLPAWKWGHGSAGQWGVIDPNAASDADLWMAYALCEAGRLWQRPDYHELGKRLARQILLHETEYLPGLGTTLLPGHTGFRIGKQRWRLNPSYLPIQLLRYFASHDDRRQWQELVDSSGAILRGSAPHGFAPDWVVYDGQHGFLADSKSDAEGSFDAIRVYLWVAMLHPAEPLRERLLERFSPMIEHVERHRTPPLRIDTLNGVVGGIGPAGFAAALLPLMSHSDSQLDLLTRLQTDNPLQPEDGQPDYYSAVLTLFGQGWQDGRYRFTADGALHLPACGDCP